MTKEKEINRNAANADDIRVVPDTCNSGSQTIGNAARESKETAVYITADPLTYNEEQLIDDAVRTFGFVYIMLDRKNRDTIKPKYTLSYADRSDIVSRRMSRLGDDFQIIPVDVCVQKSVSDNGIGNIILNHDAERETDFRSLNRLRSVLDQTNIFTLGAAGWLGRDYLTDMLKSDMTMQLYRKCCSDYAYAKLKLRMVKLVGITSTYCCPADNVIEEFRSRDYYIIDLDEYIRQLVNDGKLLGKIRPASAKVDKTAGIADILAVCDENQKTAIVKLLREEMNGRLINHVMQVFGNQAIVKCSMLHVILDGSLFSKIICLKYSKTYAMKCLLDNGYDVQRIKTLFELYQTATDRFEGDLMIDADKPENVIRSSIVQIINGRLRKSLES